MLDIIARIDKVELMDSKDFLTQLESASVDGAGYMTLCLAHDIDCSSLSIAIVKNGR